MFYVDFEISLYSRGFNSYDMELRFSSSKTNGRFPRGSLQRVVFDREYLDGIDPSEARYGQYLTSYLFADKKIRDAFRKVREEARNQDQEVPVHFRLFIGPDAQKLHNLQWETLRDPLDETTPLLLSEDIRFSRFLTSLDWRSVYFHSQVERRALVSIANPSDVTTHQSEAKPLTEDELTEELTRIQSALGEIPCDRLSPSTKDTTGRATQDNLCIRLRQGYDILYLVCYSVLDDGEPYLLLENNEGVTSKVAGFNLVNRLKELDCLPQLIVLDSYRNRGGNTAAYSINKDILAMLALSLAKAGVPAVLAIQDSVSLETTAYLTSTFFRELQQHGQIDRAMARARHAVRDCSDWWMPVLFMRLRSGRVWYRPGFQQPTDAWQTLLNYIKRERCTPILGPGLSESWLGSPRDIAQRWAETYNYPLAPPHRQELHQVAQFLAANKGYIFPRDELVDYLLQQLRCRYQKELHEMPPDHNPGLEREHGLFDVFLSHNSQDKPAVCELKRALVEAGLSCWLDVDELVPGENWQPGLEAGIRNSVSAAVCFGPAGIGPWEDEEMQALLTRAVKEKLRVIPVLLPDAPEEPAIPLFLGSRTWIDLRSGLTGEGMNRLIWGITGRKPEKVDQIRPEISAAKQLNKLISALGKQRRDKNQAESYQVLSHLPFSLYITTNPDRLLVNALQDVKKAPQFEFCRWREESEQPRSLFEREPDYRPDAEHPLVFQLFGSFDHLDSLVLTEDDYFDFLISLSEQRREQVPDFVKKPFVNTALLFLGFRMDDWNFRVLCRSLVGPEGGSSLRGRYTHVAVQIDPEEDCTLDSEGARRYLRDYFAFFGGPKIHIYWGSTENFAKELSENWERFQQE